MKNETAIAEEAALPPPDDAALNRVFRIFREFGLFDDRERSTAAAVLTLAVVVEMHMRGAKPNQHE